MAASKAPLDHFTSNSDDEYSSDDMSDEEVIANLGVRQRVALTLKNWCIDEANMDVLLDEGAVSTLVVLASLFACVALLLVGLTHGFATQKAPALVEPDAEPTFRVAKA